MSPEEVLEAVFPIDEEDQRFGDIWFEEYENAREWLQQVHNGDHQQASLVAWTALHNTNRRLGRVPPVSERYEFLQAAWYVPVLAPPLP